MIQYIYRLHTGSLSRRIRNNRRNLGSLLRLVTELSRNLDILHSISYVSSLKQYLGYCPVPLQTAPETPWSLNIPSQPQLGICLQVLPPHSLFLKMNMYIYILYTYIKSQQQSWWCVYSGNSYTGLGQSSVVGLSTLMSNATAMTDRWWLKERPRHCHMYVVIPFEVVQWTRKEELDVANSKDCFLFQQKQGERRGKGSH